MNSAKLRELIKQKSGNLKAFTSENGIKYTTLYNEIRSDEQLDNMTIKMFRDVANGLGMTFDELMDELEREEQ